MIPFRLYWHAWRKGHRLTGERWITGSGEAVTERSWRCNCAEFGGWGGQQDVPRQAGYSQEDRDSLGQCGR